MRTINVKTKSTRKEILFQVAKTLQNDILDDENMKGSFFCEISDGKVNQYELDEDGEIFGEAIWYVDEIVENGFGSTVNIDC